VADDLVTRARAAQADDGKIVERDNVLGLLRQATDSIAETGLGVVAHEPHAHPHVAGVFQIGARTQHVHAQARKGLRDERGRQLKQQPPLVSEYQKARQHAALR
jgi:hypothetical protein